MRAHQVNAYFPLDEIDVNAQPPSEDELHAAPRVGADGLGSIVDDLLAFVGGTRPHFTWDVGHTHEVLLDYLPFWSTSGGIGDPSPEYAAFQRDVRRWVREGVPEQLLTAARAGAQGRITPELAGFLGGVRYLPHSRADVADLPAFAGWALDWLIRLVPFRVIPCERCRRPFVALGDQRYCVRQAPGHVSDCRTMARNERFREANRGYRREYQRLDARHKRGRLDAAEWRAWRDDNRPGDKGSDWKPFEDWKTGQKPESR